MFSGLEKSSINIPLLSLNERQNNQEDEDEEDEYAEKAARDSHLNGSSDRMNNGHTLVGNTQTNITVLPANNRSAEIRRQGPCSQLSWITVLLISTILTFLLWKGVEEVLKYKLYMSTNANCSRTLSAQAHPSENFCSAFSKDYGQNQSNFTGTNSSQELFSRLSTVLMAFNENCERDVSLPLTGCINVLFPSFTIQRLRMRLDEREKKAKQLILFTYKVKLNPKDDKPLMLSHRMSDLKNQGLGNWMFMVSSLYGASRISHRIPVITNWLPDELFFRNLKMEHRTVEELFGTNDTAVINQSTIFNPDWGKYDGRLLNFSSEGNMLIDGYTQSFQTFDIFREQIHNLFYNVFNRRLAQVAIFQLQNALTEFAESAFLSTFSSLPRLVGVHVRRGDILREPYASYGYKPATEEYLLQAVFHVQMRYAPVIFVVISNDMDYCRKVFKEPNFLFLKQNIKEVDLMILSLMDYIILSVGSFGWWGAYLSQAHQVYYYPDWPRNGSEMYRRFSAADYFPTKWIALS